VLAATLVLAGCSGAEREQIVVDGSTTVLPIAEVSGEMFDAEHAGVLILASGMGSSAGIENVSKGSASIGTSSRDLKDTEADLGLVDTPIAYDAIAVIVHPSNVVQQLSTEEIRGIFAGEITNWREVGGEDAPIGLVNRDEASGTREAFSKMVMKETRFDQGAVVLPGTGQVRAVVAEVENAIGYISLGFVNGEVRAVAIDGVAPTEDAVAEGTYGIRRVLHFFTKGEPTGTVRGYIEYVLSPEVQDTVVRDAGFIPIAVGERAGG
jgi:phosphate transport system substrate-binding protein